MSFIDLSKKNNDGNNLFPQGTYEVVIKSVKGDASKAGHECMDFDMVVRKDLDKVPELAKTNAKTHGRHYFPRVYTAKDKETGQDSGEYRPSDLANIADAIGLTQAQANKIKSKEELFKACKNKLIRLYISVNENEYQGQKRKQNSTFTNTWQKTKYPLKGKKAAKPEDPFKDAKGSDENINDDDLPF